MKRRKRMMAELDRDIREHIERETQENIERGMPPEEARRAALLKFGNVALVKEDTRAVWTTLWLEELWRDVRYGLRMLRKSPGFTVVAIVTLALGIGANTAIFSVVDATVLHPLPYPHPGQIVALYRTDAHKGVENGTFSYDLIAKLRGRFPALENLTAFDSWPFTVTSPGEPEEVGGVASSSGMFELLGIGPVLGRTFTANEDRRGAPPVAMISETVWHARFHSDPAVLGKVIGLDGKAYTIVGVFPGNLHFPGLGKPPGVWVPLVSDPIQSFAAPKVNLGKVSYLECWGRLKSGTALRQAQAQADALARELVRTNPERNQGMGLRVASLEREVSKNYRTALAVLLGAVGLLLLIACVNVANLLLARETTRQREMALRLALGASKFTIARQLLVESLEVALAGGIAGASLAYFAVNGLQHWIPASLTQFRGVSVNGTVLGFAAAVSVVTGMLFGFMPAWRASDLDAYATLKESGRGTSGGRHRVRETLVVVEVALAVMLLVGAGLLLTTFAQLSSANPGFQSRGVALGVVDLSGLAHASPGRWRAFVSSTLGRLRAEPGVTQAAAAVSPPMGRARISFTYSIAGQPAPPAGQFPQADYRPVTPGYFALMRIPLIAGRDFAVPDSQSSARVCAINQALVRVSFADANPLGQSIIIGRQKPCQVVGVVGNVTTWLGHPPQPAVYIPFAQSPFEVVSFVARGPQGTATLFPLLRDSIRSVDRSVPIETATLSQMVSRTIDPQRFRTVLMGIFASLAILLAAVGISGVLGYSVSRRTQEIGLRMALGASPREVLQQIVGEGLRLVVIGSVIGIAAALVLTRFMRSLLYGISPADPLTYVGVVVLFLLVALVACWVPARRAMRVDPMTALRNE